MAIEVSKHNISGLRKLAAQGERAMNSLKRVRKEGEHVMEKVLRTAETGGTAFGLGLLNGYHGPITIAKIPLELLLTGVLELGGYLGLAGKHSDHLNNMGDGALAAFGVIKGVQIGAELKAKHAGGAAAQPTLAKGVSADPNTLREMIQQGVARDQVTVPAK